MRRSLLLALALAFVLPACEKAPPTPRVSRTPATGSVEAGTVVEVRASRPLAHKKEPFEFHWSTKGDCAGKPQNADGSVATYTIPKDCAGGELVFELESGTRYGSTRHAVSFQVTPLPGRDPGLLPLRPSPLPADWVVVNDFSGKILEKGRDEERRNNLGGYFETATHRDSRCELAILRDKGNEVGKMSYFLRHDDQSQCFYLEYFASPFRQLAKSDATPYDRFGFMAKTDAGQQAWLRVELVEFDEAAQFSLGVADASEPILVDDQWRRYEVHFKTFVRTWDRKSSRSIGFRLDARDHNTKRGTLYFDDLVLLKKQAD